MISTAASARRWSLFAVLAVSVPILLVALWMALTPAESPSRRYAGLLLIALGCAACAVLIVRRLHRAYAQRALVMSEEIGLLMRRGSNYSLLDSGAPEMRILAARLNEIAEGLRTVDATDAERIAQASAGAERDRNRLAALIADLPQAVLVCNAASRIVLYNARARHLFDGDAGGTGLDRPLAGAIGEELAAHVRNALLATGGATPVALAVPSPGGRLLRIRAMAVAGKPAGEYAGCVLLAEDVTRAAEQAAARERLIQGLLQDLRSAVLQLRSSGEAEQGAAQIARQLDAFAREHAALTEAGWLLEDMRTVDLLRAARARMTARLNVPVACETSADAGWVRVDSFSFVQALSFLAQRVVESCDASALRLLSEPDEHSAVLRLLWDGTALSTETAMGWELEPMTLAGESSAQSVREVMRRHGAELTFGRERAATQSFFCIRMPCAPAPAGAAVPAVQDTGRPEFFDFDLFERVVPAGEQPLAALSYTVFDCETTGLDPAGGDEIIQIGAVRIVGSRLLQGERFLQLVDPQRDIPAESVRIHGITREATRGAPAIAEVLPRFHAFAGESVLVGHNVAFDMRFLQLKERASGVRFAQPVLDTLLLSAILHPNLASHRLEDIAARLGVSIIARHDAMGDALATAQVFLRMIDLLAGQGIVTLAQAREASEKTWYARLRY